MDTQKLISGERPLYGSRGLHLSDITFGEGESALKCSSDIDVKDCRIEGKYVFWECRGVSCRSSYFAPSARACSWYGSDHKYESCTIDSPKMFRELDGVSVRECTVSSASETFWRCRNGRLSDLRMDAAEYCFFSASDFFIERLKEQGNYSFQYARNFEIHDSVFNTKDAFWESDGCTVYDSVINGEYLGWYSRNLRLVRCRISGTQPLCYCKGLVLEDCVFDASCDRCFEKSQVEGTVLGGVASVEEPVYGKIIYK
ncbi:MAG: DUF3737 family protein [Bacteroidales bacterium]|nr:DUF3737 family protein [Bacteroidales bacterium]